MPDDIKLPPAGPEGGNIKDARLADALSERYLAYALSTIMSRSLPDVRDGLKPVHRRLLWAMHQLKLDPAAGFKKCARIVGDVMGKYHPHGDAAIYDAMVRLAQDFAARYPLVEGQGNFGNIDGDNAAAMRYTEARLTEVAQAMLAGIDEDTVDFRATYDGEEQEPVVLPAAFPNLLANGANGIAVGMATSIPPHNAGELCAAALAQLEVFRERKLTLEQVRLMAPALEEGAAPSKRAEFLETCLAPMLKVLPGPDFPTGGVLVEPKEAVREAYATGRGGFRVRARWEKVAGKNGTWQVVVSEIPYQVAKAKLIEQIAQLMEEKKLPLLGDIRDESTDIVRIVLEPKSRTVDPAVMMETLFRATALEARIPLNMNVLDADRTPRVMGLPEVVWSWLDHRHVVLVRRTEHRLAAIARRLEILAGYLIVYLNLDEVIRIVREEDKPKDALMARFELTEVQANAILDMRLRALRKLEEMEIRKEHTKLAKEQKALQGLMQSEGRRWETIEAELRATQEKFGAGALGTRRTETGRVLPAVLVDEAAFVEKEPITVILSEKGWIRAQKGHIAEDAELRFKEGDGLHTWVHAQSTDRIVIFATNGKAYTLKAEAIPRGRGDGQPVRLMVDLTNEDAITHMFVHADGKRYLVAATDGRGFVVKGEDLLAEKRTGKQVLVVEAGKEACACAPVEGDTVAVIGTNRKLLLFPLDQVPEMARGRGVQLQSYKDAELSDLKVFARKEGLSWMLGDRQRVETDLTTWRGNRAGAGKLPPNGFPKSNRFE
ncbi:DNA topoisomerase IV subunit A [Paracraurococcus ruber]|uniref:DNA topoisomerase 4 subunit A n=1 Tax=Paracraurococcus ruber TaxID=77675 RepID=A0ABS1CZE4_9PROT|nr:DNA topoisomerase IV subunit A [Paracraurococcus ruber]MBK1659059.1 DNA topoisomerase IV subunit A [Paracraurococcus ruber]TDG30040.1 DNA topoisomerase IV subunit A [Paracraurococcus ruber]